MSRESDFDDVVRRARGQGFRVQRTKKGHWQFFAPSGNGIAVASGTLYDGRSRAVFLTSLKHIGYTTNGESQMTTVMEEALRSAQAAAQQKGAAPAPLGQPSVSFIDAVRDVLRTHDRILAVSELKMILVSRGYANAEASLSGTLTALVKYGEVSVCDRGQYRWGRRGPSAAPAPAATPDPPQSPTDFSVPGTATHDASIDDDLIALDEAIAALARLEAVIRRNRAIRAQVVKLKQLLGGLEG